MDLAAEAAGIIANPEASVREFVRGSTPGLSAPLHSMRNWSRQVSYHSLTWSLLIAVD